MKFLETRTEIAKAINFKQYPTIRIDVSKTDDYGIVGTHVLIDNGTFRTGEPYYTPISPTTTWRKFSIMPTSPSSRRTRKSLCAC